jgi:hypothetical protein
MVIPWLNTQQADVPLNERQLRAPSNEPAIMTSKRTVHKSQDLRTPTQELPVAVTTASYVALEDKDLQPLS